MYSTTAYLYQQRYPILLIDTSGAYFTARWDPVYSKPITLNKGVDNVLLFEFVNQDQKPVNITGSTFTFRLISQNGRTLMLSSDSEILSATYGRLKVLIESQDLDQIEAQPCSYSIERYSGGRHTAAFVDEGANGRGQAVILDSTFPEFTPSQLVTVPSIYGAPDYPSQQPYSSRPDWALPVQSPPISTAENYSSYVNGNDSGVGTFILNLNTFTGNIKIQGAETYESAWYDVNDSQSFYANSSNIAITALGYHNLLRVAINQYGGAVGATVALANATVVSGTVTAINLQNAGAGYLAEPLVVISGAGTGATAVATINNSGTITNITVTNGGSGYSPLPPSQIAAQVTIVPGLIESITFR
jgi:hypothetical protein